MGGRITKNSGMEPIKNFVTSYVARIPALFTETVNRAIEELCFDLLESWEKQRSIFVCGNGGSAANAIHISNDLHYGVGACGPAPKICGLKIEALTANTAILTCLANDDGYDSIFSHQLYTRARKDDILITLSGSGNSENIISALNASKSIGMKSHSILAFSGGKAKNLSDNCIHFEVNDMQLAEDTQLIVGHMCMQWLNQRKDMIDIESNVL